MSRQISFFHSEHDSIRFVQEIDKNKGMILIGDSAVPPTFVESMIIPSKLVATYNKTIPNSATIEFDNCCKGNSLSRTYEVGRIYLAPIRDGNYVPETAELYESLRKYIKTAYHFEKKAGAYFSLEFWEKYYAHYYYATCAGKPVLI